MAKRESKFDILRLLLMFMIVIWHAMVHGLMHYENPELQPPLKIDTFNNGLHSFIIYFILYVTSVSVDCFVLISGYFSVNKHRKLQRLFNLWITTFFYSFLLFVIFRITGKGIDTSSYKDLFPIMNNSYWFITQYLALMLISPFLNIFIASLNKESFKKLLLVSSVLLLSCIGSVGRSGAFALPLGNLYFNYFGWFIYLYLVGGYIRLYNPFAGFRHFGKLFLSVSGIFAIYQLLFAFLKIALLKQTPVFCCLNYNGLTFILAVLLFLWVKNLHYKENKISNFLAKCSPYVFGIYLIHDNQLVRHYIWQDLLHLDKIDSFPILLLNIIFIPTLIFMVCLMIDYIRGKVFTFMKIDSITERIVLGIRKIEKLINY